ncbi:MAG: FAD-dependent oxidoreductase [Anaerolineae bacterium]
MHLIPERCTGCGYCVLVCPYDALKSNGWAEVIPANCTDCNLCVYACPNDCFVPEPEFPLKPYRPRIKDEYEAVIIGSGLGGLMSAVALAQAGHSVAVFEKLSFPGGRYTELDYKGVAVTTGAWTNLGPKSHIGRFLSEHGIELEYVSLADLGLTEQYQIRFPDGRCYTSLFDMLSPIAKKAYLKAILDGRKQLSHVIVSEAKNPSGDAAEGRLAGAQRDMLRSGRVRISEAANERMSESAKRRMSESNEHRAAIPHSPFAHSLDSISAADYIAQFSADPDLLAAVEAIAATASGLSSQDMPAGEYLQITLDGREAGQEFAMPTGGVRAIIKALTTALRRAGGELFVRTPVAQILVETLPAPSPPLLGRGNLTSLPPVAGGSRGVFTQEGVGGKSARGIRLENGHVIRSRLVIHNGGPSRFLQLVGADHLPPAYVSRLAALKGVACAALFGATRQPLFTEAPITMTPGCRRIVGIFSPTLFDPHLSKSGLHLFDAFFPLHSADRAAELELALADLRDLFPHFDETVEWTVPMFFTGAWPGTESGQTFGQTGHHRLDPITPIQGCYLVGMDIKGSGVAGDLIPLGVRQLLTHLNHRVLIPTPEFGTGFE